MSYKLSLFVGTLITSVFVSKFPDFDKKADLLDE